MARGPRVFAPGLLYHVIVCGNQRLTTFLSDGDSQWCRSLVADRLRRDPGLQKAPARVEKTVQI